MIIERKPTLRIRLEKLLGRKRNLENRIADEMKRPAPDAMRLQSLKRLRLRAKDEITTIRARLGRVARTGALDPSPA